MPYVTQEHLLNVVEQLRQEIANLIEFSRFARTSSLGQPDGVAGLPGTDETYDLEVRRMQHYGFRSVPVPNSRCLLLYSSGNITSGATVAEDDDTAGPQNLAAGETALYCKASGTVVKLDMDGNIEITAADGKSVTVNGGTAKVAREGDPVDGGTVTATVVGGAVQFVYTPAGGGSPVTSTTLALTGGRISGGAPRFKG